MRLTSLCFVVSFVLTSCAFQAGPVAFAFGQAGICRGEAEAFYSATTGELEQEVCSGGFVTGGAISDTGSRAVGVVGRAAMSVGKALGGVPAQ